MFEMGSSLSPMSRGEDQGENVVTLIQRATRSMDRAIMAEKGTPWEQQPKSLTVAMLLIQLDSSSSSGEDSGIDLSVPPTTES
jgi:hypothetical protein